MVFIPEGEDPLLVADGGALDHEEVLLHLAVVGEAAHGVNGLVSQIVTGIKKNFNILSSGNINIDFLPF